MVTGADSFFIIDDETKKNNSIRKNYLVPIVKTAKDFHGLNLNGYKPASSLIKFPRNCSQNLKKYLDIGEKNNFHKRAHSLRRSPWYAVNLGETPDAFFPYRVLHVPYLVLNSSQIQCTNSIHRIYFNNISDNAKKWIQISLLSSIGQLSLEAYSKTYGSGVLKIEPISLKNAIAQKGYKKINNKYYEKISLALKNKNRAEAVKLATDYIKESYDIPSDLADQIDDALIELQNRRLSRSSSQ